MPRLGKKWLWLILPAAAMVCLLAVISERAGLAEAGGKTAVALLSPGHRLMAKLSSKSKSAESRNFLYWTHSDCEWVGCYRNNPFNTYSILAHPTDPKGSTQECSKLDVQTGVCTNYFPMSGNDALVLYGRALSTAKYFNFIINQADRSDGEGGRELTESSLGLGINSSTLKTYSGDPFGGFFWMIVTANTASAAVIKNALIAIGYTEDGINEYLFHRDFANGYLGEDADRLNFFYRIAHANEEEVIAYSATSPVKAILFKGLSSAVGDVETMDEWVPRSDSVELDQLENLRTLITKIVTHYWPEHEMPDLIFPESLLHLDPFLCRGEVAHPELCHYDNPDALYINFTTVEGQPIRPLLDEDDFIILAGINHNYYQLTNYFSYFLYRDIDLYGFTGFMDDDMIGSAQQYWALADDSFFAYKIAFNCLGDPWCHEIPTGEWGIEPGEQFLISGRILLDPVSKTGPDPDNFVPTAMLYYVD